MKAVVLHANKKLVYEDCFIDQLGSYECQIKVAAAGICSSDIYRSFDNGAYFYPLIMGHELSGEVVLIGNNVTKYKIGDKVVVYPLIPCKKCESCVNKNYVYCKHYDYYGSRRHGGFSEYLNVHEWNLILLPNSISLDQAASLEPLSVCIHALERAGLYHNVEKLNENKKIAILGAGFLGLLCSKILSWIDPNLNVTLIDRNKFKLEKNKSPNHENIFIENKEKWESYLKKNSDQFSYIIESCGSPDTFRYSIQLAKPGATIVWMGNIFSNLDLPKLVVSSILRKELNIKGT